MSMVNKIRNLVPQSLKNFLRQKSLIWRLSNLLSPSLPKIICVDVGASYYPHIKWILMLNSPNTEWLAIEPNDASLDYIRNWAWKSAIFKSNLGLSREGGTQTLYLTNEDTGSSLLPPEISKSMQHRVKNLDYFFPVTPKEIETQSLVESISDLHQDTPVFVKLDTQGTELSILQGSQILFDMKRIVGIEIESTLLAEPIMKGGGKFWQVCEYLEKQGFELLNIKPIKGIGQPGSIKRNLGIYLNECDAVFSLRRDVIARQSVEYRVSLLAFYVTNLFLEEALSLMEDDVFLVEFLKKSGCDTHELKNFILNQIN